MPLFLATLSLYWAAMYVYVPILSVYAQEMGASLTLVGLLVGAYGFTQMLLRIPTGIVSDRTGRRQPFLAAGFVAAGLGALGLGLATDPALLVVARGIVGIAAATWVASTVLFAGFFPPGQVARAIGLLSFVAGISQLVATTVGGQIADLFGSRSTFFVAAGVAAVGLLMSATIPEARSGVVAPSFRQLVGAATVPSLLVLAVVAALTQYASWATTYGFLPIYADRLGATRGELGLLIAASLATQTGATLLAAPLMTRLGARLAIAASLGLLGLSVVVVPLIGTLAPLAVAAGVGGAGRGLSQTLLMSESIRSVPAAERATAMGVFQAVYAVGMFVGPVTAGILADGLGLANAFIASGALVFAGIPLIALRRALAPR